MLCFINWCTIKRLIESQNVVNVKQMLHNLQSKKFFKSIFFLLRNKFGYDYSVGDPDPQIRIRGPPIFTGI